MTKARTALISLTQALWLPLAFAAALFSIVDTYDIRVEADQGNGCTFWSHTDNRAIWTGVETVTTEGITCPEGTVTRVA